MEFGGETVEFDCTARESDFYLFRERTLPTLRRRPRQKFTGRRCRRRPFAYARTRPSSRCEHTRAHRLGYWPQRATPSQVLGGRVIPLLLLYSLDVLRQNDKTVNPTRKTHPKLSRPILRLKMPASVTSVPSELRRCPRKLVPSTCPAFVHTVMTILLQVLEVRLRPSFTTW